MLYPEQFRIHLSTQLIVASDESSAGSEKASGNHSEEIGEDFVKVLCNQYFRMRRNVEEMKAATGGNSSVRKLTRALKAIETQMDKSNILCLDLTGQAFEDGRKDFEIVGEPVIDPELSSKTITFCERPAILFNGRTIQASRGIVSIPPH